ncbi:MAG TPA: sulfurtransferase [Rhodanobacteraceae bacterium]|nr:sulfurtransferase [Rhodanobacteraceae bacterium]
MTSTLLSCAELAARDLRESLIVDCRFELADTARGERDYRAGHIPGAVYAHLDRDLSSPNPSLGRHPLPSAAQFAHTLAGWGWQPGRPIVAYDDANGAHAARLWWMLRVAGVHAETAVLDGGWAAWRAAGLPLSQTTGHDSAPLTPMDFDPRQIVYQDELRTLLELPDTLLLDARAAPRYHGENEPIDRVGGHVPGARNRPFSNNLEHGIHKSPSRLKQEFDALLGGRSPRNVVHMCGSGVTACSNLLAMEHAGLHGSRLFAPSWSGWIADPSRPIRQGVQP